MLKNYNYMLTIILYPFILLLSYLKLTNYIKGDLYAYLILIMLIIFVPSFIMSLYASVEEILNSEKKWRIIFMIFLSIIYLPIYYTKYIAKEEKYLGYILFIIYIPLTILTIDRINLRIREYLSNAFRNYVVIDNNYIYCANDYLYSINVDMTFRCNNNNIGDYDIACDRLEDDSFIGIYRYDTSYDKEEDIDEKIEFHIDQTLDYITDSGYEYEIVENEKYNLVQIDYNENSVLITSRNYDVGGVKYSLIILKEIPRELINYDEYQKMIDSIQFLNYNGGVSS